MSKRELNESLVGEPTPPKRPTSSMAGALLGLLLALSSFGLAAIEDEAGAASEAPPVEDSSLAETPDQAVDLLQRLVVAEEVEGSSYDRAAFKHWVDLDRNGCDTRQEVLIRDSRIEPTATSAKGCPVTEGEWFSLYDGIVITNPSQLDIDHMVPLKEAWDSTASTWTPEQRQAYANDLDEPLALIAVTASTNRSKADRDPAEWKPPEESVWCSYATAWVKVKIKWALTVDIAEHEELQEMLALC